MGLRFEVVEDANFVALAQEQVREVRADQTGATGYQSTLAAGPVCHRSLPPKDVAHATGSGKLAETCSSHAGHRSAVALARRSAGPSRKRVPSAAWLPARG